MASPEIPRPLRTLVRSRAGARCEYCKTSEWLSGLPGEIDHIVPRALDGPTEADNLCLVCSRCNGRKQAKAHAVDPESETNVCLFHPRRQRGVDHFAWSQEGTIVLGLTACGRATVAALNLNDPLIVAAPGDLDPVGFAST